MFYILKKIARAFLVPLVSYLGNTTARRYIQYARARKKDLLTNTIFYESFHGDGMNDNPFALFQIFEKRANFAEYTHVWVSNNRKKQTALIRSCSAKYRNVLFVTRMSTRYVKFLARARYLVNNNTFPSCFVKRPGQVYLNTGEGISENQSYTNLLRNFLSADFILATKDDMPGMYADSYKLRDLYDGLIIRENVNQNEGSVSERVLDILLNGSTEGYRTESIRSDKKRICFDSGALKRNGITFSLINLLKILDYNKYDVTVCTPPIRTDLHRELVGLFPREVRVLPRSGSRRTGTIGELVRYLLVDAFGVQNRFLKKLFPAAYLDLELKRTTACGNYDAYIQFSGYDRQAVLEISAAAQGKKLIWQHSDMYREQFRSISGKIRYYQTLNAIFSFYPYYDIIVACSRQVMEINQKQLPSGKYHTYCHNAINYEKILAGMTEDLLVTDNDRRYIRYPAVTRNGVQSTDIRIPLPEADTLSFVTIGRLSMEKNHENLIRAFASFSERHPNSLLYIIGDGVMFSTLETVIHELRLDDRVILVGAVSNPFRLSCECGCFILPSLYEGQPVVLLEARVQNLPIIVSNFETVASALMENGQFLIGTGIDDIVDGMNAFAEGRVPRAPFDYRMYNETVSREFDALMEG